MAAYRRLDDLSSSSSSNLRRAYVGSAAQYDWMLHDKNSKNVKKSRTAWTKTWTNVSEASSESWHAMATVWRQLVERSMREIDPATEKALSTKCSRVCLTAKLHHSLDCAADCHHTHSDHRVVQRLGYCGVVPCRTSKCTVWIDSARHWKPVELFQRRWHMC